MPNGRDLYEVLGVPRNADAKQIKRAYFELAKEHHPDKGGNTEKFQEIQRAFDILSDGEKRGFYDATGSTGEEGAGPRGGPFGGGGGPFGFPFDIGAMFGMFGGGGPPGHGGGPAARRQKRPKGPNKTHEIGLKLADFYHGRHLRVEFDRQAFCSLCAGEGCKTWKPCDSCHGSGTKEQHIMVGPGMVMVQRGPCPGCGGEGKHKGEKCESCSGNGVIGQHKALDIHIEPGSRPGDILIFKKECSDHPDFEEAGDVHIVLSEAEEETVFKREGDTLCVQAKLTLLESLLGCERTYNGHPAYPGGLVVQIPAGTQNSTTLTQEGKGMIRKGGEGVGELKIFVQVEATKEEIFVLSMKREELKGVFNA
jgi:DnaJ-class molecular chaperone